MQVTIFHTEALSPAERDTVTRLVPGEWEERANHLRLHHRDTTSAALIEELRRLCPCDVNPLPVQFDPAAIRLLVTDMDSTLINIECIDEIADFAGRKGEVAAITEAAMRGEIDFATSLTRRVSALEGLDTNVLHRVYDERLRLNPGAEALIEGLKARGIEIGLVSGGFTFFTGRLRERLGLHHVRANLLEEVAGRLTGKVLGEIVDAEGKRRFLEETCGALGVEPRCAIAMGDGANDLQMMRRAGLGIAYRAKPKVQAEVAVALNHSGLDAVLHLLA